MPGVERGGAAGVWGFRIRRAEMDEVQEVATKHELDHGALCEGV